MLKITLVACGLALLTGPAFGQAGMPDSFQFIKAVKDRDGNTATQLISDHPTIVNAKDGSGDTGLIVAIRNGDKDWMDFLLYKGADANMGGAGGDTPLIAAARVGFDEGADTLIRLGAKVDAANKSGETPLIVAVQQRDSRLVRLLLEHGADPDHADSVAGYSARDYATRDTRSRDILKLINDEKPTKAGP
jgi:ankyrin repeat protein